MYNFPYPNPKYFKVQKNKIYNIPIGFDIETTNVRESKKAYMYIWQCAVYDKVYHGRTWDEFRTFLSELKQKYKSAKLFIFVHNLPFEMSFLLPRLELWGLLERVFAKERNKPLSVELNNGIVFRDTMALENCSLSQLAKRYCRTQKLPGEALNYDEYRNSTTQLSELQMQYCDNDVLILSEYAEFLHKEYTEHGQKIPLTSTGIVRQYIKNSILRDSGKINLSYLYPETEREYGIYMRWLFRGGFVHANTFYVGEMLHNVKSQDLTSAYPSVMLQKKFPSTKFINVPRGTSPEEFQRTHTDYAFIILAEFTNIIATKSHVIESKHKCIELDTPVIENGRVFSAVRMTVLLTDVDYMSYKQFYKWDTLQIHLFKCSRYRQLPPYITDAIIQFYAEKKRLKAIPNKTEDEEKLLMKAKGCLNSVYGMTVSRMHDKEVKYKDMTYYEEDGETYESQINNSYLSPFWGIWVTAFVRQRILNAISVIDTNAIYSDTDSIKYKGNYDKLFDEFNTEMTETNKSLYPHNPEIWDIGLFDDETKKHKYSKFKTYGAKRYIYMQNGVIHPVIAGLPRKTVLDFAKQNGNSAVWDFYQPGMTFEISGKLTHIYNGESTDTVNGEVMHEYGSCYLETVPFTMTVDRAFLEIVTLRKGEFV